MTQRAASVVFYYVIPSIQKIAFKRQSVRATDMDYGAFYVLWR